MIKNFRVVKMRFANRPWKQGHRKNQWKLPVKKFPLLLTLSTDQTLSSHSQYHFWKEVQTYQSRKKLSQLICHQLHKCSTLCLRQFSLSLEALQSKLSCWPSYVQSNNFRVAQPSTEANIKSEHIDEFALASSNSNEPTLQPRLEKSFFTTTIIFICVGTAVIVLVVVIAGLCISKHRYVCIIESVCGL